MLGLFTSANELSSNPNPCRTAMSLLRAENMDRLGWELRGQSCRSILARPSSKPCWMRNFTIENSHSMNHQGTETRLEPSVRGIQCTTNLYANTVYSTYIMCVYHVYVICHAFIIIFYFIICIFVYQICNMNVRVTVHHIRTGTYFWDMNIHMHMYIWIPCNMQHV